MRASLLVLEHPQRVRSLVLSAPRDMRGEALFTILSFFVLVVYACLRQRSPCLE